jgi:hypothetical protein
MQLMSLRFLAISVLLMMVMAKVHEVDYNAKETGFNIFKSLLC